MTDTYCPGAIEKRWVTIRPDDSPISQLLGKLPDGTLVNSEGKHMDRLTAVAWYDAWHEGTWL